MDIRINENTFFVFDLDDTLFHEIDYLKSAYRYIAKDLSPSIEKDIYETMLEKYHSGNNVFKWILSEFGARLKNVDIAYLLKLYCEHLPEISLSQETAQFIERVQHNNINTGLITDGRSITQRNKLKALGIDQFFNDIIISEEFGSEKPDERNYLFYEKKYPGKEFYFFGDNTGKDFIVPNQLGWTTVCLKNKGSNIHEQDLFRLPIPDFIISSYNEINLIDSFQNQIQQH